MSSSPPSNGKVRPIIRWGTPILHGPIREMASSDFNTTELDTLVADMFATMYAADGAGLAANQIGVDLKIFVYDVTDKGKRSWGVFCNPVIEILDVQDGARTAQGAPTQSLIEGCLSFPGICASVPRHRSMNIRGVDQRGMPVEVYAEGQLAGILQHETDHLNGIVYGDHVPRATREKMDKEFEARQAQGGYPEEWPVGKANHEWTTVH